MFDNERCVRLTLQGGAMPLVIRPGETREPSSPRNPFSWPLILTALIGIAVGYYARPKLPLQVASWPLEKKLEDTARSVSELKQHVLASEQKTAEILKRIVEKLSEQDKNSAADTSAADTGQASFPEQFQQAAAKAAGREIPVRVWPGEITEIKFRGEIAGGFKSRKDTLTLDRQGATLVLYPSQNFPAQGEGFIVQLKDGRAYFLRAMLAQNAASRDVQLQLEDSDSGVKP